jgi:hypothetical protein
VVAAGQAVKNAVAGFFDAIATFFLSLVGAAADFVGQHHEVVSAAALEGLVPGAGIPFALRCNGGSEGIYVVSGQVDATTVTGTDSNGIPWREYSVRVDDLFCEKESEWDRFTSSDEPFVVGVVIPHGAGSSPVSWRTEPFANVDTGEHRAINRASSVRVARRFGFISIAAAVYESDDETPNDRNQLMNTFAGAATASTTAKEKQFGVVLTEAIAAAWRPGRIEVAAFRRGATAELALFAPFEPDRWVDGGEQIEWTLQELDHLSVAVPDTIDCDCGVDCGHVASPARLEQQPPISKRPSLPRPARPSRIPTVGIGGPRGRSKTIRAGQDSNRPPEVGAR